jgi:hypothetical protein
MPGPVGKYLGPPKVRAIRDPDLAGALATAFVRCQNDRPTKPSPNLNPFFWKALPIFQGDRVRISRKAGGSNALAGRLASLRRVEVGFRARSSRPAGRAVPFLGSGQAAFRYVPRWRFAFSATCSFSTAPRRWTLRASTARAT